jgi:hypothetical protein
MVLIWTKGKDADTILNGVSNLSTTTPEGHVGVTKNLLALVPPLNPSLNLVIELLMPIIV